MRNFYATTDVSEGSATHIAEDAEIHSFSTLVAAEEFAKSSYINGLDDGEYLEIITGEFADCWVKERTTPESDDMFDVFTLDELYLQAPGQHPGGKEYWITPRVDVLISVVHNKNGDY